MKEIKLTNGTIFYQIYKSNIDMVLKNNQTEHNYIFLLDEIHDFSTEQNFQSLIDDLANQIELNQEDIETLRDAFEGAIYMHSSEVFE